MTGLPTALSAFDFRQGGGFAIAVAGGGFVAIGAVLLELGAQRGHFFFEGLYAEGLLLDQFEERSQQGRQLGLVLEVFDIGIEIVHGFNL